MSTITVIAILLHVTTCSADPAVGDDTASANSEPEVAISALEPENVFTGRIRVKLLSKKELDRLLSFRLSGQMGLPFGPFGNMFLVSSRLNFGCGIGLMTSSQEIIKKQLDSPFPEFYKPTLREFLDAIALQTASRWTYDARNQYVRSDEPRDGPVDGLAMFEFIPQQREKPYSVTLAKGWKTIDNGHWTMYVPPTFPVGMDIYEMGVYSAEEKSNELELMLRVRKEVALDWARRIGQQPKADDLKSAMVGDYEALQYDALLTSKMGDKQIHWRHWVFMVENKCYFVVSTILPELEEQILPDVKAMMKTFRVVEK